MGENEAVGATDRFAEARRRLFPPLRNRKLAQAADALADNRTDIAEALLSQFLEKHPADPHALNLMADIARRAGRFDTAARHLSRCIELEPDCAGYRFNFVVILRRLDKFGEALAQLDELLGKEPRNPLYRDQKAAILRMMGRLDDALVYRRELAQEYPKSPQVWLDYGHSLRGSGAQETCIAAYRKALELAPSLAAAYSGLAELKIYHFTAAETARMETLQATSGLSADDRADIHFALGKAYGDQASYARSFDNYAKGNALLRLNVDFDPERLTAHRQNCESLFTRSFFVNRAGWGASSEAPIFIVGMPRSGSTLVEQILSSHSAIEGLGELADLDLVVGQWLSGIDDGRPPREFWIGGRLEFRSGLIEALPKVLDRTSANEFRALGEAYLNSTRTRRGLRQAVLHRQGASELRICRPDPPDPAPCEDHRRAQASARLRMVLFQESISRGAAVCEQAQRYRSPLCQLRRADVAFRPRPAGQDSPRDIREAGFRSEGRDRPAA